MLKIIQTIDEALDMLSKLSELPEIEGYKLGLTGSYVHAEPKKSTKIDIVLQPQDGVEISREGRLALVEAIHNFMDEIYSNKYVILFLDMIMETDAALSEFMTEVGYPSHPVNVSSEIVSAIRWLDVDTDRDTPYYSASDAEDDNEDVGDNEEPAEQPTETGFESEAE